MSMVMKIFLILAVLLFGIIIVQIDNEGIVIKGCTFTEIDPNGVIKW